MPHDFAAVCLCLRVCLRLLGVAQTTIQGLIVLAHAGSVQTQRVFVMAMRNAVALGSGADKESQAMADNARQNRRALFTNAPAKHLLKQLLRCAAWGDAEIRQIADEALAALSADVTELIANAKCCVESADLEICQWVALSLFRRTINPNDESNQHVIYTIESMHPYAANTHISGKIVVLGASQLSITFDPVSRNGRQPSQRRNVTFACLAVAFALSHAALLE